MPKKRTDRDLVRRALHDAIDWQRSYAQSWASGPEADAAWALVKEYRGLLMRRYGYSQTPSEASLDGAASISLSELQARAFGAKEGEGE